MVFFHHLGSNPIFFGSISNITVTTCSCIMITVHLNNTKNTNYPQNLEILSCLDKLLLA